MGVYELSGAGSVKTGRTLYTSMNANNQYGAMVPIATAEPNNAQIVFNNIPQIYQDLMIVVSARSAGSSSTGSIEGRFNGDTGSNYSWTWMQGNGTSAISGRGSNATVLVLGRAAGSSTASNFFCTAVTHILNYSNTSTNKTVIERGADDQNGSGVVEMWISLWRSTAAITSITMATPGQTNFAAGSTATLYGIRAANS